MKDYISMRTKGDETSERKTGTKNDKKKQRQRHKKLRRTNKERMKST